MIGFIAYVAIAYLTIQFGVVLANALYLPLLRRAGTRRPASVSVLIPARNEAQNIGNLLKDLQQTGPEVMEILIYDDDSVDGTGDIIQTLAKEDGRIRYLKGEGPEDGWLGKNHACHELAKAAFGDYFLFLDADVRIQPELVVDAVDYASQHKLDLLSLFPVQEMHSLGEWLTIPLMNKILLGNLPLFLIGRTKWKDLAAANGQFMLFRADTYRRHQFHLLVRDERVEDISIIKRLKLFGHKAQTLLSDGQIKCRMYRGYDDALNGFSKNVTAFFGDNWLYLSVYVLLTTLGPLAIWSRFSFGAMALYILVLISTRVVISSLSRQNWMLNVALMPLQQATLGILSALAAWRQLTGQMEWKGRRI